MAVAGPREMAHLIGADEQNQCLARSLEFGQGAVMRGLGLEHVLLRGDLLRIELSLPLEMLRSDTLERGGLEIFGLGLAELDAIEHHQGLANADLRARLD